MSRVLKIVYISAAKTDRKIVGQDRSSRDFVYMKSAYARGASNVSNRRDISNATEMYLYKLYILFFFNLTPSNKFY